MQVTGHFYQLVIKNLLSALLFSKLNPNYFQATLYLAATNLRVAESKDWWGNVHGFDMGSVSVASLKEVEVGKLKESDIVSHPCLLAEFSLYNCKRWISQIKPWNWHCLGFQIGLFSGSSSWRHGISLWLPGQMNTLGVLSFTGRCCEAPLAISDNHYRIQAFRAKLGLFLMTFLCFYWNVTKLKKKTKRLKS